jgi:hypothetical protein
MTSGMPTGISTPSPLTWTSVCEPADCAPDEDAEEEPYAGNTNAAPSSIALHIMAATVSQNA